MIDGKKIAEKIINSLEFSGTPGLSVILVGNDPASELYTRKKIEACKQAGIHSERYELDKEASEDSIIKLIEELNNDKNVHGILIQLPLPKHVNTHRILAAVDPAKDVDGFTPMNLGRLMSDDPYMVPATPLAVMRLIDVIGIEIKGKNAVVVGHSMIVGKPLAYLLLNKGATVTVCHEFTKDLAKHTIGADILVSATGVPHLIKKDMVKPGATVIDVGISYIGGRIVGDVDFEEISKVTDKITPVPGGVGPVTIACLLENTVKAQKLIKQG